MVNLEKKLKMPVESRKETAGAADDKKTGFDEANKELAGLEKKLNMPVEKSPPTGEVKAKKQEEALAAILAINATGAMQAGTGGVEAG